MENLGKVGGFLAAAGIISGGLHFVGMNLRILMWIDLWGPTVGWLIRGGLVVGGGALYFLAKQGAAQPKTTDGG